MTLRFRQAARALLLDPDESVLLVRFEFPTATVWGLPGGGLDDGESVADGLRRELSRNSASPNSSSAPTSGTVST